MTLQRDTVAWRVLVELAGQNRAMTLHELYDALDLVTPEDLHRAAVNLVYGATPYAKLIYEYHEPDRYLVTWEGQEALPRLDAPPVVDTQPLPKLRSERRKWWRR